jgi:hypothetical protein
MQKTNAPDWLPCEVRLEPAPASPAQAEAWRCLWRLLLAENGATTPPQKEAGKDMHDRNSDAPGREPEASQDYVAGTDAGSVGSNTQPATSGALREPSYHI